MEGGIGPQNLLEKHITRCNQLMDTWVYVD